MNWTQEQIVALCNLIRAEQDILKRGNGRVYKSEHAAEKRALKILGLYPPPPDVNSVLEWDE